MQKKKQTSPIKQIILYVLLAIIVLLIVFAEDIIKLTAKNKIALQENNPNEAITVEANAPVVSAGMIPVKWNGENWEITTKEDEDWYDYKNGKLAYVMLNDGYYRSEIERGVEQDQLMQNNIGVGVPDVPSTRGTIFAWIPRFAYNEDGDIQYIKDVGQADENCTIPDIFTHKQVAETSPDFLLTGIWFEIDVDNTYTTKINQMNTKDSIYGFIKNTIAIPSDQTTQNEIQQYIANTVGASIARPQIADITNPNRIILHIINQNNQDWVKAKGEYNKQTGLITIQVTYTQYGINKIILENEHELTFTKENGIITATTEGIDLEDGKYKITIIDNKSNEKILEIQVVTPIYVAYYSDRTLAFGKNNPPIQGKTVTKNFGDISGKEYNITNTIPWYGYKSAMQTVNIVNRISPISTANWFSGCKNLTDIINIENLNTNNVTTMYGMFDSCSSLKEIDLTNFNTSNVTNMMYMFWACSGLTKLDLSNFDTGNVINMYGMFGHSRNLTSLDLSNFNTSNVTNMDYMFYNCSSLTALDLSNFDTSKVTNMYYMFCNCSSLATLDLSSFNTSNIINMSEMFRDCSSLISLNLSSFDTSSVIDMTQMFWYCSSLISLNLSNFDTSSVTDMSYMFYYCTNLTTIYVGDNWKLASNTRDMFYNCGTSVTTPKPTT